MWQPWRKPSRNYSVIIDLCFFYTGKKLRSETYYRKIRTLDRLCVIGWKSVLWEGGGWNANLAGKFSPWEDPSGQSATVLPSIVRFFFPQKVPSKKVG
jgi:hypothetical protein